MGGSYRLYDKNIGSYLKDQDLIEEKIISRFFPLLQSNFGGPNDCTLTSITAVYAFVNKYKESFNSIYDQVETVAKKHFFTAKTGTAVVLIKSIIDKTFSTKSHSKYLKGIGFNWFNIKNNIKNNIPMILSTNNDGRNYYKNHTVIIVGYKEYNLTRLLVVYDNWNNTYSYIDYDILSIFSAINYF